MGRPLAGFGQTTLPPGQLGLESPRTQQDDFAVHLQRKRGHALGDVLRFVWLTLPLFDSGQQHGAVEETIGLRKVRLRDEWLQVFFSIGQLITLVIVRSQIKLRPGDNGGPIGREVVGQHLARRLAQTR